MSGRFRWISAAILSVFFGSTYSIFSKFLLQWTIPETLILLSQIFSVLTVLLFFWLVPELKDIRKLDKKTMYALLGVAIFSSVIAPLLFMKWLSETLAINAIVTSRLSALFVGIMGFVWLKERVTRQWLVGTTLMFLGILCITMEWFTMGLSVDRWVILVAFSALSGALGHILYKKYLYEIKPEVVILVRYAIGFVVFILVVPILLHIDHDVTIGFQADTWIYFLWLALIPIVWAIYLRYEALDHLPVSLAWVISLLNPLFGMILASIFLHEELYIFHARGTLLLLAWLGINLMKKISYLPAENMKKLLLFRRNR